MSARAERAGHAGPRPPAVDAVVQAVVRSLRATHALESVLLLATGVLSVRCAALLSPAPAAGGEMDATGLWLVSLLAGVLCAAAWWFEHPVDARATARALDEHLRHHGALATAWDLEQRGRALLPLEELVRARVLERLRFADALRVLFPPLLPPVLAPTLAGLCLVLLVEARRAPAPAAVDLGALADGLARQLAVGGLDPETAGLEGEDGDGGLSRRQVQELESALRVRSELPYTEDGWRTDPEGTRARLAELDRRLSDVASRLEPGSEVRERLEGARPWLDALRAGLAEERAEEPGAGSPAGEGTESAGDGTIRGSPTVPRPRPMDALPRVPASEPPATPLGVQSGTFWPREYDAVVERWVERTRARRDGR